MGDTYQNQHFTRTQRDEVIKNNWTTIVKEKFINFTGDNGEYIVVERNPGLMIIPLIKLNNIYYTYLVKQYRYPIAKWVWQFPMGTLDKNADPLEHAKKELIEETGLQTEKLVLVGDYYIDPGLSRQRCMVYIATNIIENGQQKLEKSEKGMIAKRFSLEEVQGLMLNEGLFDGWMFPGLYYINIYMKNHDVFF